MPVKMKDVYAQIEAYPDFNWQAHVGYCAARYGWSWCTKQNNVYIRKLWRKIYLCEPTEAWPDEE